MISPLPLHSRRSLERFQPRVILIRSTKGLFLPKQPYFLRKIENSDPLKSVKFFRKISCSWTKLVVRTRTQSVLKAKKREKIFRRNLIVLERFKFQENNFQ